MCKCLVVPLKLRHTRPPAIGPLSPLLHSYRLSFWIAIIHMCFPLLHRYLSVRLVQLRNFVLDRAERTPPADVVQPPEQDKRLHFKDG